MKKFKILSISLDNFKNVKKGVINLGNFKEDDFIESSRIMGLYGQNGSGKTSLVEAIQLVTKLMWFGKLPDNLLDYILNGEDYMIVAIEFYLEDEIEKKIVEYKIKISKKKEESKKNKSNFDIKYLESLLSKDKEIEDESIKLLNVQMDETIKIKRFIDGKWTKKIKLIDIKEGVLKPNISLIPSVDLKILMEIAKKENRSKIFNRELLRKMMDSTNHKKIKSENEQELYALKQVIELSAESKLNIVVINNKVSSLINSSAILPIEILNSENTKISYLERKFIRVDSPEFIDKGSLVNIKFTLEKINVVLKALIPNLEIKIKSYGEETNKNNILGERIELFAHREETSIPLKYESDGIKKICSVLMNLILVYNNPNFILVIDELDANIFEYLLGEILYIVEKFGKGQLIFTSHNLRPLEILDKKHLRFTTSNPEKRYTKIFNIKATNNLRNVYIKNVFLGNEKLELYKGNSTSEIRRAFKLVGCCHE